MADTEYETKDITIDNFANPLIVSNNEDSNEDENENIENYGINISSHVEHIDEKLCNEKSTSSESQTLDKNQEEEFQHQIHEMPSIDSDNFSFNTKNKKQDNR